MAKILAPFPGRDCHVDGRLDLRRNADLAIAAQGDRADVGALGELIDRHDLAAGIVDLIGCKGDLHTVDLGRVEQPPGVIAQPEYRHPSRGAIGAHTLEHRGAVVQRVGEHVHRGLLPRHEFAIEPDVGGRGYGHDVSYTAVWARRAAGSRASVLWRVPDWRDSSMRLMTSSRARLAASMMLVLMLEPR